MDPHIPGRRLPAVLLLAAVLAGGCELKTSEDWNPLDDAPGEPAPAPAQAPLAPAAAAEPQAVWLWDLATGERVAVAAALPGERAFVPAGAVVPMEPGLGGTAGTIQPATATVRRAVGTVLALQQSDPDWIPAARGDATAGDGLIRLAHDARGPVREELNVVAAGDGRWWTTCPRAGAGLVFAARTGAWVPAVWLPDPAGGCPLLATVDPAGW